MTDGNSSQLRNGGTSKARRIALLASVAAIGGALLIGAGPFGSSIGGYGSFAATAAQADTMSQATNHPQGFADLVAKVKPAVISVRVKIDSAAAASPASMQEFGDNDGDDQQQVPMQPGSPLQKFFQQFGQQFGDGRHGAPNGGMQRHQMMVGEGSGFFISADGYAVTNNHVVDHAKSVQVTTDGGAVFTAKVIGTDPKTDLAVIKVDGKTDFPFVKFSDDAPRVGDWVVAVGNPFGLGGTVTAGIVSARGRDIGAGPYDDYVQIDAPINKGNSGGPAFDVNGNVIGVNTAIYSPSGGSVGIGFDIPAETAKLVVAQLEKSGHVTRGWLGVQIQPVTQGIADSLGLKKAEGAMVDEPQKDSPAAKAGIQSGDVITAVNGTAVKDARDLARTIGMMAPDSSVKLDIIRQGETKTVSLSLAQMPNDQKEAKADTGAAEPTSGVPHLGLQVAPAREVDGAGNRGVVVTAVDPDGPAAEQGFQTGTVILDVGGKAVANVSDVRDALKDAQASGKHSVLMRVKTGEATRFVALPIDKA
ncbi:MAG TPA: Do family serine endopeptidase [Xanthobacteraceae bacterium]|nr:Do family serine endopeptidase [Xanthobacteraceae bacterium]